MKNWIVIFLITCKFTIPNESTRKNNSITMNSDDGDHSQIELVFLIIHACNSIINKREKKILEENIIILITYDVDP